MTDYHVDTVLGWRGRTVRDAEGEKLGTLGDVLLDRETDLPAWIGVRTGLFGRHESYVPLEGAEEVDGDVRVPYSAQQVKDAPHVDPDITMEADDERRLFEHFGRGSGATMIRSEEEVTLGEPERRPVERVRLRKVVVTENRQETIPVRREVVQLEHEPPPPGRIESVQDAGEAPADPPPDR
jgi:sporulation protein YlmC with PRC-barrel domain